MLQKLSWGILVGVLMAPTFVIAQIQNAKIELTDGRQVSTPSLQVSEEGELSGPQLPAGINLTNVLSISSGTVTDSRSGPIRIELLDGGFLSADSLQISDEQLNFQSAQGISLKSLSLENLRGITFSKSDFDAKIFEARSPDSDVVVVKTENGLRRVPGILEGITSTHVLVNYQGKSRRIALSKVTAVITADLELQPATGTVANVELIDGSRLVGNIVSIGESAVFQLAKGKPIAIPTQKIVKIQIDSDALAYLSDLVPLESIVEPQFAPLRSVMRDRSITNGPLSLHDSQQKVVRFSRGLGTMAYSRLSYQNTKDFDQLKAIVGIDSATNGRGDCVMSIRGDGVELWSKRVRGKEPLIRVEVSVKGIKTVELIVEPGENFDLADHANWCDIRFLKTN